MAEEQKSPFDANAFYERLLRFAQKSQGLAAKLPKTEYNMVYGVQLIRSSSSPGSNYIEAQEATSRKDFIHKLKLSRKEIKESVHWARLIKGANSALKEIVKESDELISEGWQLIKILSSSIITSEKKNL